mmetsp:Transcript_34033/g.90665  ORF Transcript_34033/g.90665 Transcript_34033/m.90665 type:complete len:274 (+) Transcript_34033:219-1040(+)
MHGLGCLGHVGPAIIVPVTPVIAPALLPRVDIQIVVVWNSLASTGRAKLACRLSSTLPCRLHCLRGPIPRLIHRPGGSCIVLLVFLGSRTFSTCFPPSAATPPAAGSEQLLCVRPTLFHWTLVPLVRRVQWNLRQGNFTERHAASPRDWVEPLLQRLVHVDDLPHPDVCDLVQVLHTKLQDLCHCNSFGQGVASRCNFDVLLAPLFEDLCGPGDVSRNAAHSCHSDLVVCPSRRCDILRGLHLPVSVHGRRKLLAHTPRECHRPMTPNQRQYP